MAGEVLSQEDRLSATIGLCLRDLRTSSFRKGSAIGPVQMEDATYHMLAAALRSNPDTPEETRYRAGALYLVGHAGAMIAELGNQYGFYGGKFTQLGKHLLQADADKLRRIIRDQSVTPQRMLYDTQENAVYKDLQEIITASGHDHDAIESIPLFTHAAKNVRIAQWFLHIF